MPSLSIALFAYWFTWRQRPHHFVTAANHLGYSVDLFSTRSVADYLRGATRRSTPESPLVKYRSVRPVFPSPRFDKMPLVAQFNDLQRSCALERFCQGTADIHIFAGVPTGSLTHKPSFLIYDCMDDWSDFPSLPKSVIRNEQDLCRMADRIWVVSEHIYRKFEPSFRNKLEYVPNGADYDHFATASQIEVQHERPVLGYIGALHIWFDARLVAAVASDLPEWDIVLVGPIVLDLEQKHTLDRPNIRFMGRQPYDILPGILAGFDVAMIPFVLSDLIKGTSPIKLFEYLAAGLPVISTSMPEVLPLREPGIVACADDATAFVQAVHHLKESNSPDIIERRKQVAQQHTWQATFGKALASIQI
jgi:glycosyltransferase involved in cell wall biosynthesis